MKISNEQISSEVYVAYTQFIAEILRQLIDQPLIEFNLTIYANEIDRNVDSFIQEFEEPFTHLAYHIGDKDKDFKPMWNQLTKTIRNTQLHIDQTSHNE